MPVRARRKVLAIDATDDLLAVWAGWFAPAVQPFLVGATSPLAARGRRRRGSLPPELRDTYGVYGLPDGVTWRWFDETAFCALSRDERAALVRAQVQHGRELVPTVRAWSTYAWQAIREQGDGHRFVWWPSLLRGHEREVLGQYVEDGRRPSRHADVPREVWSRASVVLPRARALAGTFAPGSGPNCFGTVMGATGVPGAAEQWMQRDPFERWLRRSAQPGGGDDDPGTVLVWRSTDGLVQHAAVTLGSGWALHKPSQGWMSPTKVLAVPDLKLSARAPGRLLERHTLL